MKDSLQRVLRSQGCEMAILFLRVFIGGVMLLHMIGKLQDYDNYVLNFQSIVGLNHATSFALSILFEGLFAVMIIMGVGTRLAAALMAIVMIVSICEALMLGTVTDGESKLEFIYIGIYISLVISGGGRYAISTMFLNRKNVPNR